MQQEPPFLPGLRPSANQRANHRQHGPPSMEHKDALVALETREIGKTLKESGGEIQEAIDTCLFFQSEGRRLYGQTVNSELPDKELFTYRRPWCLWYHQRL